MALRWQGQTLGFFGYWSPDIYSDDLRTAGALSSGGLLGVARHNTTFHMGPDLTLNLRPFGPQVWLDTQVLFNRESNPTGFDEGLRWWGGFSQLHWKPLASLIVYGRYDWLRGSRFDDTTMGGGTGPVKPREWAAVIGVQWYTLLNLRLITEYSHHAFRNPASSPSRQEVEGDTVTLRIAGAL